MIKKVLAFISVFIIILSIIIIPSSAFNNYQGDGDPVYTIAVKNTEEAYNNNYTIRQYNINEFAIDGSVPFNDTNGFMYNTFGSIYGDGNGNNLENGVYTIILYNETYFELRVQNNKFSLYYYYTPGYDQGYDIALSICTDIPTYNDIAFYINKTGQLRFVIYETGIGRVIDDYAKSSLNFYGVLFPYNEVPIASYEEGYNKGYGDGVKSGSLEAYNKGFADGQDSTEIPKMAIEGFFNGLVGFFGPFLSIGIGNLTLYSLLFLLVAVFVTITIIKIVRG